MNLKRWRYKDLLARTLGVAVFLAVGTSLSASTLQVDGGILDVSGGSIHGGGFVLGADAELRGNGAINAPATLRGTVSPGAAGLVGVLTFGDTVLFDGAVYLCHVTGHETLDRIVAAGNVAGTATVEVDAGVGAIPLWQVIVEGAAGSDYDDVSPDSAVHWGLDTTGSLNLRLTSLTGDSDLDGMPDYWEVLNFGGRTAGVYDGDDDYDGFINLHEFLAETDPNDPVSLLKLVIVQPDGDDTHVTWLSVPGKSYAVYGSGDLTDDGNWGLLADGIDAHASDPVTHWTHVDAPTPCFYQVRLD